MLGKIWLCRRGEVSEWRSCVSSFILISFSSSQDRISEKLCVCFLSWCCPQQFCQVFHSELHISVFSLFFPPIYLQHFDKALVKKNLGNKLVAISTPHYMIIGVSRSLLKNKGTLSAPYKCRNGSFPLQASVSAVSQVFLQSSLSYSSWNFHALEHLTNSVTWLLLWIGKLWGTPSFATVNSKGFILLVLQGHPSKIFKWYARVL